LTIPLGRETKDAWLLRFHHSSAEKPNLNSIHIQIVSCTFASLGAAAAESQPSLNINSPFIFWAGRIVLNDGVCVWVYIWCTHKSQS
jgi:hypothetical protein